MLPRGIQSVPGLRPDARPSERFEQFARMIVSASKADADREMEKSGTRKKSSKLPDKKRNGFL